MTLFLCFQMFCYISCYYIGNCYGRSNDMHDVYAIMFGGNLIKRYLKVLTIGQQAHLDVNSTKVNQPDNFEVCMP